MLGIRGSCLGIGTDIGGSIRSPAANQGLFGLKPTSYRLPLDGFAATMFGQEQIVPVIGPLSTSLEGIKIFMKTLIDQKPWLYEPSLVPIPWRETSNQTVSPKSPPLQNTPATNPPPARHHQTPLHRHPPRRRPRQTPPTHPPRPQNPNLQTLQPPIHNPHPLPTPQPRHRLAHNQQSLLLRRRRRRTSRHSRVLRTNASAERLHHHRQPERQSPLSRRSLEIDRRARSVQSGVREALEFCWYKYPWSEQRRDCQCLISDPE